MDPQDLSSLETGRLCHLRSRLISQLEPKVYSMIKLELQPVQLPTPTTSVPFRALLRDLKARHTQNKLVSSMSFHPLLLQCKRMSLSPLSCDPSWHHILSVPPSNFSSCSGLKRKLLLFNENSDVLLSLVT